MPTHFPSGISTVRKGSPLYQFGQPDPSKYVTFFDDFLTYTSDDWTITLTQAGTGSASVGLVAGVGGSLGVTNDDADNDAAFFQLKGEAFRWAANKDMFFKARFKVDDATASDLVFGLVITDTTPLANTDGIYFSKADASTAVNFNVNKNSTTTQVAAGSLADDTWVTLAFVYDASTRTFEVYVDDVKVGHTAVLANAPDDEDLTVTFGIQNGAAAAKSLTVDYLFAAQAR